MLKGEYKAGDYYVICDFSGFKILRSQARRMWNGLLVKKEFWEPRHPQDFPSFKVDRQTVRGDKRPEPDDVFI